HRVAGHVGHDPVRRSARLVADAREDHDHGESGGRPRHQADHPGAHLHAGGADHNAMSKRERNTKKPMPRNQQRGIALITVLIAITITLVISNEFGTSTNVDIGAAANYRDQMRAHFLARSAQNLAEL